MRKGNLTAVFAAAVLAAGAPSADAAGAGKALCAACADLAAGRQEKAVKALDELLGGEPVFPAAYVHRAVAKKRMGDAAGAASDYRESLKTPKEGSAVSAGDCACSKSLEEDVAALAENFKRSEAEKKEGIRLFLDGKTDSALARFDAAVSHDPSDPESRLSRAVASEKAGKESAKVLDDYQDASRFALAAGRWDMAADALLASAKLKNVDDKKMLPVAVTGLKTLMDVAPRDWDRRGQVSAELKTLEARLAEVFPPDPKEEEAPPGKDEGVVPAEKLRPNDPRPDGEDKGVPDTQVPDTKEPETKQPPPAAPIIMKPPPH